jgi:hypothetical protein
MPHSNMSRDSQMEGRRRLRKMLDGTCSCALAHLCRLNGGVSHLKQRVADEEDGEADVVLGVGNVYALFHAVQLWKRACERQYRMTESRKPGGPSRSCAWQVERQLNSSEQACVPDTGPIQEAQKVEKRQPRDEPGNVVISRRLFVIGKGVT